MDLPIIIPVILLLATAIALARVSLVIISKDYLAIKLRIAFFTVTLYDDRKKKRIRASKYAKKSRKKRKNALFSAFSSGHDTIKKSRKESDASGAKGAISLLSELFEKIIFPIIRSSRIRFKYFRLSVSSGDPSDTAILYGVLCQGVSYLLNVISQNAKMSPRQLRKVKLECDFISEKTTFDVHLVLSVSIWKLISLLAGAKVGTTENVSEQKEASVEKAV